MEKRVTLAIVLCVAVFLLWNIFFIPKRHPRKTGSTGAEQKEAPAPPSVQKTPDSQEEGPGTRKEIKPKEEEKPRRPEIPEKQFTIENDLLRCKLTNRGASIVSLKLKKYFDKAALAPTEQANPEHWLETLKEFEKNKRSLMFQVRHGNLDLNLETWRCIRPPDQEGAANRIDFEYTLPDGVKIIKELHFKEDSYAINMVVHFVRPALKTADTYTVEVVGSAGIIREPASFFTTFSVVDQGEFQAPLISQISDHASGNGWKRKHHIGEDIRYLAVSDKYFLSLLTLPPNQKGVLKFKGAYTGVLVDEAGLEKDLMKRGATAEKLLPKHQMLEAGAVFDVNFPADSLTTTFDFILYAGPRSGSALESSGLSDFENVLDVSGYNMCGLSWIIIPVSGVCKFFLTLFNSLVHNYGFAILMLTLLVKLLMYPLTRKQMLGMQKYQQQMSLIKPEIDKLNAKYKTNPKKKQQELMKLYKENNMSMFPMAGCLPLLVNIPVFFGLFHALRSSMELRHAPFVFWIKDLSAPDALITFAQPLTLFCNIEIATLNILPIIMGITWFAQMYFAPKPADPQAAQTQKVMMFMPVMFMFMLYSYASGLSLYWTCNSILGLIEQKIIKRGRPMAAAPGSAKKPSR